MKGMTKAKLWSRVFYYLPLLIDIRIACDILIVLYILLVLLMRWKYIVFDANNRIFECFLIWVVPDCIKYVFIIFKKHHEFSTTKKGIT